MALINCPECGIEISSMAKSCPKCAHPIMDKEKVQTIEQTSKQYYSLYANLLQ